MALLARLMETLSGKPHLHNNSRVASQAASELRDDAHKLAMVLRPYVEADDPLVALMTDTFNRRQMKQNGQPPH